jgi:glycosyltransferase involved in cell wall biosynthesis
MPASVWQVPETCGWNDYVREAEHALASAGWTVLHPSICHDTPALAPASQTTWTGPIPAIVHLHWPEKLAAALGPQRALALMGELHQAGTRIVQTLHNLAPHEPRPDLARFRAAIDAMTDGVHYFSAEHELVAREHRPALPALALHLPHPRYSTPQPAVPIACLGRLRPYKRTAEFAAAILAGDDDLHLLVAGHPDDAETDHRLRAIAEADARLDYRPGFLSTAEFRDLLAAVEWVVLPYQQLHSSGVLVEALQAGRRVLSVAPLGGTALYGSYDHDRWLVLPEWDDQVAIRAWRSVVSRSRITLPTWPDAASALAGFYAAVIATPPRRS